MLGKSPARLSDMASFEVQLASTLNEVSKELAHAESLDYEQRAEIYAIIEALRSETQSHSTTMKMLSGEYIGETDNA